MSAVQSKEVLFNDGWEFAEKEIDDSLMKKENGDTRILSPEDFLQDAAVLRYAPVFIPHDWLITDTNNLYRNSIGFYRKEFELGCTADTYTAVRFDGVYMNCAVFVNGRSAGIWKYGYTSFEIDLSPFVHDGRNSILVIAVYQSPNSRWYSGAGIYRNVHLCVKGKTRFVNNGIYIVSKKESSDAWRLSVSADIAGCTDGCSVRHLLCDMAGNVIAEAAGEPDFTGQPGDRGVFRNNTSFTVLSPELWDTVHPSVYSLTTELVSGSGEVIDSVCQHTGFRTIVTDPDKGLFLNGRHIKINGVCMHHDLGLFGAAFNVHALERQFFKLKKMGVNSIRTAHNPPAPEFMDLADTMGFLIDDEAFDMWQKPKTPYDYSTFFDAWYERDTESWIKRDRNHPCLFMWSIGNEIYDTHFGNGLEVTKKLKALVRLYDPEKNGLVTIGSNYMAGEGAQACADELDLAGYNYGERLYAEHHQKHPSWCMYGSETSSTVQSRGIYHFPASYRLLTCEDCQCSSLGNCSSNWGAVSVTQALLNERDTPWSMGQYVWTGWDYIGEPTPYFTKNSYFGQIDTAGFEKDTYWLFKAGWTDYHTDPFVHLLPYWDFNEGQLIDIRMYTNAPVEELFLNGVSQGKVTIDHKNGREFSGVWQLPYTPGVIKAAAYNENGNVIAEETVQTPGDPDRIVLERERCGDTENMCFIDISTVDAAGIPVPDARNCITVEVRGGATLCGLDNGDSTDYDRYQPGDGRTHTRRLFSNRLLAVVRADTPSSEFSVTAVSSNLKPAELSFPAASLVSVQPEQRTVPVSGGTPVRKIELTTSGSRILSKERKSVTVKARIYPADASYAQLEWRTVRIEGIRSECAEIAVQGDTAVVTAAADGNFRLRCTCSNGRQVPEVMSDLEFTVSGMGNRNLDPYCLIEACRYDSCLVKPALSFLGGVYTLEGRNWFLFNNVDFGKNGADTVTIPVFSFDTELPLSVWDGCPDDGGRKLFSGTYKALSIYNTYSANIFVLPERLYGIHRIAIATETRLSLQGFFFKKTEKAFAQLWAGACETITGDSFTRTSEAVTGIGNNVSLVYTCMDFGTAGTDSVTICGRTHSENNTITVQFAGDLETENRIVEFPFSRGYEEKRFSIDTVCGLRTVSFIFLPGSCFDFKWFRFEKKES